jgi:hypothetical protein
VSDEDIGSYLKEAFKPIETFIGLVGHHHHCIIIMMSRTY